MFAKAWKMVTAWNTATLCSPILVMNTNDCFTFNCLQMPRTIYDLNFRFGNMTSNTRVLYNFSILPILRHTSMYIIHLWNSKLSCSLITKFLIKINPHPTTAQFPNFSTLCSNYYSKLSRHYIFLSYHVVNETESCSILVRNWHNITTHDIH